ncbi:unnamed protein product [Periconia digitata]|uniref:Uncharacterized protein n=1 Tax=Periconia digitata TaxID=1303443 RepID=A0A9W4UKX9_9PLEO|nr:unnamed protein product [Periconia digitata]
MTLVTSYQHLMTKKPPLSCYSFHPTSVLPLSVLVDQPRTIDAIIQPGHGPGLLPPLELHVRNTRLLHEHHIRTDDDASSMHQCHCDNQCTCNRIGLVFHLEYEPLKLVAPFQKLMAASQSHLVRGVSSHKTNNPNQGSVSSAFNSAISNIQMLFPLTVRLSPPVNPLVPHYRDGYN